MKILFYIASILSFISSYAEDINLIGNGQLEAEQSETPSFWVALPPSKITLVRGGGPKTMNCVILRNPTGSSGRHILFRQEGIRLVPGEKYRLSGYLKAKNLTNKRVEFVVHNHLWHNSTGIKKIPVNSSWKKYEHTFTAFSSENLSYYGVAILLGKGPGELAVADLKLEPLTTKAKTSSVGILGTDKPKLVPITPRLYRIPLNSPFLHFKFFPGNAGITNQYICKFSTDKLQTQKIVVKGKMLKLDLSSLPVGEHILKAQVFRADKKLILNAEYPIRLMEIKNFTPQGRKLNNLVTELVNKKIANNETVKFVNSRDGWIYISAPNNTEIIVDKKNKLLTQKGVCFLPAGNHSIKVSGNFMTGRIVINAIPEILVDSVARDSYVKGNGKYDWEFVEKYILPAVTTITRGWGEYAKAKAKKRGLVWLSNFMIWPSNRKEPSVNEIFERLKKTPGMIRNQYDGFTADEIFGASPPRLLTIYTDALRKLSPDNTKLIYTWLIRGLLDSASSIDFLSACVNASQGKGKILFEAYCLEQKTKNDAKTYLNNFLCQNMCNYKKRFPGIIKNFGVILGNFNQIPLFCLEHYPNVDMKYYLDMQLNIIANNPAFDGLRCIGYWGTYYADEEMVRWSFRLMRHYALEGHKEMLSKRYGFTYKLDLLKNCDFENGLEGWTVSGKATSSLHDKFGKINLGLWYFNDGNKFCLMTREKTKATEVSQMAQNLDPEKLYVLQFVTADYKDVKNKKFKPRDYGIEAILPGAKIIKEKSFVHISERNFLKNKHGEYGAINLNRIIFRPGRTNQKIIFSNKNSKCDEKLILSFVQLKPYYLEFINEVDKTK